MEWMLLPYKRYFDFSGRSCRKEYWMFQLLWVLMIFAVAVIFAMFDFGGGEGVSPVAMVLMGVAGLFVLGSIIPGLLLQVRRFHDQDKSGWMVLLNFVPYAGGIIVLVFMCLRGTNGPNRFGPDPLGGDVSEVFH